jgi:hypothetical protein
VAMHVAELMDVFLSILLEVKSSFIWSEIKSCRPEGYQNHRFQDVEIEILPFGTESSGAKL